MNDEIFELREYIADHQISLAVCASEEQRHQIQLMINAAQQDLDILLQQHQTQTNNTEGHTVSDIQENTITITSAEDSTVSVTEAATLLGVTGQTIRNYIRAGRFTKIQHGKSYRISVDELHGMQSQLRETRVINSDEQRG